MFDTGGNSLSEHQGPTSGTEETIQQPVRLQGLAFRRCLVRNSGLQGTEPSTRSLHQAQAGVFFDKFASVLLVMKKSPNIVSERMQDKRILRKKNRFERQNAEMHFSYKNSVSFVADMTGVP